MNDVTFTMDQIRREAFRLLADTRDKIRREASRFLAEPQTTRDEKYSHYAAGVIELVQQLSELAGEDVKDSCLDKSEEGSAK